MILELQKLKEFEKKFGFECYNELVQIIASMYQKIEELTKSRDSWRGRYTQLAKDLK